MKFSSLAAVLVLAGALGCASEPAPPDETTDGGATTSDGGTLADDGGTPDGNVEYGAPDSAPQCTSGLHWTRGDRGSASMHPGGTCLACHIQRYADGPRRGYAGTVFPTTHEPDDCNGAASVTVEVTDSAGHVYTASSNGAGNFYNQSPLSFPIKARVIKGDKIRAMLQAVPSGDCNGCHTQDGAQSAPGRIVAP